MCKPSKRNSNGGLPVDKSLIEICKAEEEMNVMDFLRFKPILNTFNLVISH